MVAAVRFSVAAETLTGVWTNSLGCLAQLCTATRTLKLSVSMIAYLSPMLNFPGPVD